MLKAKLLFILVLSLALLACKKESNENTNSANNTFAITDLLVCKETTISGSETQKTVYCAQPENGMTVDMVGPYILALATCNVSWQAMQDRRLNEYVFSDIISNHFNNAPNEESALTPKISLDIFTLPVKNFRSGFGPSPGFVITFDSDFATIKDALITAGILLDECDKQSCALQVNDTETILLQDTVFGCVYSGQR